MWKKDSTGTAERQVSKRVIIGIDMGGNLWATVIHDCVMRKDRYYGLKDRDEKRKEDRFYDLLREYLGQGYAVDVFYEAGRYGFAPARIMLQLGAKVHILPINKLKVIMCGKVIKTDKLDAKFLSGLDPEELAPGSRPKDASAIAAWAWGYSRVLDGVLSFPEIDEKKAFCIGHSRLGKSALWAGVQDERFGMVCVNNAGCGGAALSRRLFGETIYSMYWYFNIGEWWFTEKMKEYAVHVENLPFDQHELLALAAPRTVVVHSASEDLWADPKGEYLAAYHAGPVYRLFGKTGLNSENPPPPDQAVGSDIRYFMRTGGHDLLLADWQHYLAAVDSVFDSEP